MRLLKGGRIAKKLGFNICQCITIFHIFEVLKLIKI